MLYVSHTVCNGSHVVLSLRRKSFHTVKQGCNLPLTTYSELVKHRPGYHLNCTHVGCVITVGSL